MPTVNMKDVRAELEELYSVREEVDQDAAARAAGDNPPPNVQGTAADPPPQATPQGESPHPIPGEPSQQPPADQQPVDWERKFKDMERRFKAVQSAVTPAQQERAALRKEVDALKAQIASLTPAEQQDMKLALEKAREVLPEAVAPIENALNRVEQLEQQAAAREQEAANRTVNAVIADIQKAHPDAFTIAKDDEGFWKHVDSFEESGTYRQILERPWDFEGGAQIVNELFSTYKEALAAPRSPSPSVPRPDVAPPVRGVPSPAEAPAASRTPSPVTSQSLQRLDQRIRSAPREDLLKIREEIVKQAREAAEQRR